VARDWLNRAFWQYEKTRTYNNEECTKNILPKIFGLKKKYYDKETEVIYKSAWETLLQNVYRTFSLGEHVIANINGKKIDKRYIDYADLENDIKKL
jgi:hypothetical protein